MITLKTLFTRVARNGVLPLALCWVFVFGTRIEAQTVDQWSGGTSTAWATGTNWVGGTAPTNSLTVYIAAFDSTSYTNLPNAGTTSIAGIHVGDGTTATAALTISGTVLSIGASGITVYSNAGAVTLSTPIKLGASQSWANNSSNLLTDSGTITNTANTTPYTLTLNGSGTGGATFSGVISDGGTTGTTALVINTTGGTTTLSGANTFTGGFTLTGGTVQLGNVQGLGATTEKVTVNGGSLNLAGYAATIGALNGTGGTILTNGTAAALTVGNGSVAGTYDGVLANGTSTLSLVKAGAANETLGGTNTYTGSTTINGGTLTLDFTQTGAPTSNILSGSSALVLGGGGLSILGNTGANAQTVNGTSLTAETANTIALSNGGATSVNLTLGALTRNTQSTLDVTLPTSGTVTTSTTTSQDGILVSAASGGTAYATANGGTTWLANTSGTLSAYSGYATGTGNYTSANNIDVTSGDSVSNVSVNTLRFNSANDSLSLAGVNTVASGGILVTPTGTGSTISGGTLESGAGKEIVLDNYGSLNVSSVIANSSSGASALTISGTGTTTLSGANTYTGATVIDSGTVILGTSQVGTTSGPLGTGSSYLYMDNGTTLNLNGNNATVGNFSVVNSGFGTATISDSGAASTLTFSGSSVNMTGLTVNTSPGPLTLNVTGANLTLSGAVFTGTNVANSVLEFSSNVGRQNNIQTALNGATLELNGDTAFQTTTGETIANLIVNGTNDWFVSVNSSSALNVAGSLTGSGTLNINNGFDPGIKFSGNDTGFTGILQLQANGGTGNNTDTFQLADSTSGNIGLTNATVNLLETGTGGTNVGNVTLQWAGTGSAVIPIGDLTSASPGSTGTITLNNNVSGTTATYQVGSLNHNSTYGGTIANGTGTTAISKVGTGIWTLSGANTYTGGTTVSAGTLVGTSTTAFGTGSVSVGSGASLDYDAAANSALTIGSLTLASGSTLGGSIGSTSTGAEINVTNAAAASGNINVTLYSVGGVAPASGTYTLLTGGAGSSLNSATYTLAIYNDTNFSATPIVAASNNLQVTVTAQTALTQAYWNGGLSGASNVWTESNGTTSNWVASAGGSTQALVPNSTTNVFISNTPSPITAPTATVLGQSLTINSLTIQDTTNGLGLNADGNTLTIMAGSGSGITMNSGVPTSTIGANVALGASQTWTNNSANSLVVSGNVSGAYALTTAGTGVIKLSGTNTYTGITTVSAGTLQLGSTTALPSTTLAGGSSFVINTGATVDLNSNNLSLTTIPTGTGGTITNNSATNSVATLTFSNPSGTLSQALADSNATTAGTGQLGLVLAAGSLTLTKTDTYTGGTVVNGGTLTVGNGVNSSVNLGSGTITLNGGTLQLQGQSGALVNFYTSNNITFNGGSLYVNDGFQNLGVNSTNTQYYTINVGAGGGTIETEFTGKDANLAGVLTGTGTLNILDLNETFHQYSTTDISNGSNTFSGTVYVNEGTGNGVRLSINNNLALSNATVNVSGTNTNVASDVIFSSGTDSPMVGALSGAGAITLADQATTPNAVALSVGGNNASTIYSGVLSGSGSLTKAGTGIFTLSGTNTYSGSTTVSGGTLQLGSNGAIPTNSAVTLNSGGKVDVNGYNATFDALISGTTGAGTIDDVSGGGTPLVTIGSNNGSGTYSGVIQNTTGTISLTKTGTGIETLGGTNTYSGTTTVSNGTLRLGSSTALPASTVATVSSSGVLDLNGYNGTVSALNGSGTVDSVTAPGTSSLTIAGSGSGTFSGVIQNTSGTVNLVKSGSGTQTLTGLNQYSGTTTVNSGTLQVGTGGAIYNSSSATIYSGGSLLFATSNTTSSGANYINGPVTLSGGTLGYAASSPSNTTVSGVLTLTSSSILDFGGGRSTGNNILSFQSLANLASGVTLTVNNYLSSGTYSLGTTSTSNSFSQDALQLSTEYGSSLGTQLNQIVFYNTSGAEIGYGEEVSFSGGGYEIVPISGAVPEPSTIVAGAVFVGLLAWNRRKSLLSFSEI